ncbi:AAA family ATPase [Propionibacterium acidifaciens]
MQILRVELCGIGPYTGTESIDFQALGADGLFLLEGPTGSGKTTIIDAIVFALYGQVSGAESSNDRLASTHLEPGTSPYVELVVDTSRGLYRVRRSPRHERAKKRGSGTTTENPRIMLWKLSDPSDTEGAAVSSNIQDATGELRRAIGLSREQFTQTVVLPQGQFATFLRSGPEERRDVLQQIFGTQVYEAMADELKELAKERTGLVRDALDRIGAAADEFVHAAWPEPSDEPDDPAAEQMGTGDAGPGTTEVHGGGITGTRPGLPTGHGLPTGDVDDSPADAAGSSPTGDPQAMRTAVESGEFSALGPLAQARLSMLRVRCERRAETSGRVAEAADAAHEAAHQGHRVAAARERHARLRREQAEHSARSEAIEACRRRADLAQRAARCVEPLRASETTGARHESVADAWRIKAAEQAGPLGGLLPDRFEAPDDQAGATESPAVATARAALAGALSEAEQSSGSLTDLLELEQSLAERRAAVEDQHAQVEAVAEQLAGLRQERDDLSRQREKTAAEAEALAPLAESLADARESRQTAATRLQAAQAAENDQQALAGARRAESEARRTAGSATTEHAAARARWLDGLAGEVAAELTTGRPCPVCGSLEHPSPASRPADAPTRDDVERLAEISAAQERALTRATAECDRIATHLAEQRDRTGGLTAARAREAAEDAMRAVEQATAAVTRRKQLRTRLEELRVDAEQVTSEIASRAAQQAALAEAVRAARAALADDETRIEQARAGFTSVADRAASVTARIHAITALQQALDQLVRTRREHAATRATALAAMAREGFGDDPAQVFEAALPDAELTALTNRITEYDARTAELRTRLADPQLVAAAQEPEPELEALDAAASRARQAAQTAQQWLGEASAQLSHSRQAAERLDRALAAYDRIAPLAEPYVRMAELANATGERNLAGITLPTFVLRHRFEQVIDRANERLEVMTHGRYSLRRTDEREGRGRRQGLGLVVVDHVPTDTERDPRTLSGGETFLASLAMALGLSDTVTSEAGGVELDSLFVDEGFGSLDPDALDMVMDQLERLRAGGRCVGVISHVAEMRQRIAERVSVRPNGDGTSTLTTS